MNTTNIANICRTCSGMGKTPFGCRACGRKRPRKMVRIVLARRLKGLPGIRSTRHRRIADAHIYNY